VLLQRLEIIKSIVINLILVGQPQKEMNPRGTSGHQSHTYKLCHFFLQQTYILKLKQPYYKEVLEEDQNCNKVHNADRNDQNSDAFHDSDLADQGGGGQRRRRRLHLEEDRAKRRLHEGRWGRISPHRASKR
jgi:hypothetical protein